MNCFIVILKFISGFLLVFFLYNRRLEFFWFKLKVVQAEGKVEKLSFIDGILK